MEIERKFLVTTPPENYGSFPLHEIEQAYLCTEPVVRIRKEDDNYYLTYKSKGLLAREEYNLPLTKEAYADGLIYFHSDCTDPEEITSFRPFRLRLPALPESLL